MLNSIFFSFKKNGFYFCCFATRKIFEPNQILKICKTGSANISLHYNLPEINQVFHQKPQFFSESILHSIFKLLWNTLIHFTKRNYLENYEKCFLFYRKSSLSSRKIQNYVLPSSTLFSFVSHCWLYRRNWLKINPKVFEIIMCLN